MGWLVPKLLYNPSVKASHPPAPALPGGDIYTLHTHTLTYTHHSTRSSQHSILAAICGYRKGAVDEDRLPLYLKYTPAGTSVHNMAHWVGARLGLAESKVCA